MALVINQLPSNYPEYPSNHIKMCLEIWHPGNDLLTTPLYCVCFQHHSLASKNGKIWFRFEMFWVSWKSSPDTSLDRVWLMFVLYGCFSWPQAARRPRPEWVLEIGWCPSLRPTQRRWPMWRHRTRSEPQPTPSHSLWAGTHTHLLSVFHHCLWVSVSHDGGEDDLTGNWVLWLMHHSKPLLLQSWKIECEFYNMCCIRNN